jgi:hypothetical protein
MTYRFEFLGLWIGIHCHKSVPTRQGLRAYLAHRCQCRDTHQMWLSQIRVPLYDPHDPEQHPRQQEPPVGWESEHPMLSFTDLTDSDNVGLTDMPALVTSSGFPTKAPGGVDVIANASEEPANDSYSQPFPHSAGVAHRHSSTWLDAVHEH